MNKQRSQYLFPAGSRFGIDNLVLHARAKRHSVEEFEGTFSIKTVFRGRVAWVVDGRPLYVDSNTLLVLNEGERYSLNIDEEQPVETRCVFFRRGFLEQIAYDVTNPVKVTLSNPYGNTSRIYFPARLHPNTDNMLSRVWSLVKRYSTQIQPSGFQEDLLTLSVSLLTLHEEITNRISKVPATKASTREELFHRLQIAKEYLHSCVDQTVSLEEVAKAACLSPYHLHRVFRQTFQKTPHQYLTDIKLKRAHTLLTGNQSVSEAANAVGFKSISSFSQLFSNYFGFSPSTLNEN